MISKDKIYKTRDGREVRIYATDGGSNYCVHGALKDPIYGWSSASWLGDGHEFMHRESEGDLIEVKPRIQRTVWLNVYALTVIGYETRYAADDVASRDRLACVKVEIDCEEGEGL